MVCVVYIRTKIKWTKSDLPLKHEKNLPARTWTPLYTFMLRIEQKREKGRKREKERIRHRKCENN